MQYIYQRLAAGTLLQSDQVELKSQRLRYSTGRPARFNRTRWN